MKYLLDTNILSYFMKGLPAVTNRFEDVQPGTLCISTVALGEIYYGVVRLYDERRDRYFDIIENMIADRLIKVITFDYSDAQIYADLKNNSRKSGFSLGDVDLQIASQAVNHDLILVTNDGDFKNIAGLSLENWIG